MTDLNFSVPASPDGSSLDFLNFASRLITFTEPYSIVEAGTFQGVFAVLAALTQKVGKRPGRVWTADVQDFGCEQLASDNGVADRVNFFLGDFAAMLKTHHSTESVDLALIDSGPVAGVLTEPDIRWQHFNAVLPYMKKGGLIIVDDTQADADWAHVDELRARGVTLLGSRGCTLVQA